MLITAKTEIRGIHMELSVMDAKECLKNPKKVQTEIRVILENYGIELGPEHMGGQAKKEERPFACPWCPREYKYEAHLIKHTEKCPNHPGNVVKVEE